MGRTVVIDDMRGDMVERKAALRRELLATRAALDARHRREAAAVVARRLDELLRGAGVRTVVGYAAVGSELSIDAWLEDLMATGVGVFLPFVEDRELGIARVRNLDADVETGWRGLREPAGGSLRRARADRIDAFVLPGAGFDLRGTRIGYGGGHFDRLLARARPQAVLVGVGFDVQVTDDLPRGEHDVGMDWVITERRVIRGGPFA